MLEPISDNHKDVYHIEVYFKELIVSLEQVEISLDRLFLNVTLGFDPLKLKQICQSKGITTNFKENKRNAKNNNSNNSNNNFSEQPYKESYIIGKTNAWTNGFHTLLSQFDLS